MESLTERELDEMYQRFLDECYPTCKIGPYEYGTAHALKNVDPTAYRCGFADWLDAEVSSGTIIEDDDSYYTPEEWATQYE